VDWIRVTNFRCIRGVDVHLTPLHALIGPNDSGKSSLLQAIRVPHPHAHFWFHGAGFGQGGSTGWTSGKYPSQVITSNVSRAWHDRYHEAFGTRALLRLDPDDLRSPVPLIPRHAPLWFQSDRGRGLASLYDALLNRDRNAFIAIDTRFRALFPTVKALRLENADQSTKTMGLTLHDDTDVGPSEMSEGMLYWLAFAVIEYIAPSGILLVEEPENGLHPARIREVMRILREVSARMQVVVATHSPLVINELQPEEVTIVTRTSEHGTVCTPMMETKNFAERSKIYALGELWLAYADGELEKELVNKSDEASKAG
jgi:predicted ATPase